MTKREVVAALAVVDTVRELGSVPAGHLYAGVMDRLSHEDFEFVIRAAIAARLMRRSNAHLLTWIGPLKGVR